ncbi:MAG: D-alanyl-D-alanine carboxypeptidase [gamma proteobacterium symbiont of Ctena orbiculata]|nr:M15 family metallopeptidase [Candidatus Thiodiazotropha taylori]PUB80849.1 MAG: D-alanyl-D-alanine carboxypeptidase [gamma proteobacterium symbiont of Ctena orbiculata]MBT2997227.1 M15 family metallopeptidase [Candidatus Thiodiazotropha taylori]MBT3001064.1 M15 family metallopeptidase [Candidatus Thiodiazotropha taylori]MBT3029456.1 M15 family metallopeptidase [Candidatus Thiodiazotropha taylori]
MKRSLAERYRDSWRDIGLSDQIVADRNLSLFEEAKELEIAEVAASGQLFHLIPAAADAWKAMKSACSQEGIEIHIVSAYRSVDRQLELIQRKLDSGQPLTDILEVLAPPGCSEHHTGRAIDIGSGDVRPLEAEFELTPAFTWLHDHAHQFGFNLSFPQGNEFGYVYEPWHWCFSKLRPSR